MKEDWNTVDGWDEDIFGKEDDCDSSWDDDCGSDADDVTSEWGAIDDTLKE